MTSIHDSERKLRVGILFGGQSAEHDVSIQSAQNIIEALDKEKFEPILIGIDRNGAWRLQTSALSPADFDHDANSQDLTLTFSRNHPTAHVSNGALPTLDVVLPILHGPLGEDGSLQGLLEMANLPYVGAGVLGSAVGMDKDIMKRLLREAGVPITDYVVVRRSEKDAIDPHAIIDRLGLPVFVKPANMGSSIGVSKVASEAELLQALQLGFQYDRKVLIEKAVDGDEIECAVLGNEQPEVSLPGRISFKANFYTYDAKYDEHEGTALEIPAVLPSPIQKKVQEIALATYKTLECEGMARVDMFVTKQGEVLVNEINTLPGFTRFSMYPQLWEASGLSYTDLITKLLELALERAAVRSALRAVHPISSAVNTGKSGE